MYSWLPVTALALVYFSCRGHAEVRTDNKGYVTYEIGNVNIVISVPHGGRLKPRNIPDRHNGCMVNNECTYTHCCHGNDSNACKVLRYADTYTKLIATSLAKEISVLLKDGRRPHLVVCDLHRSKLDANREYHQATFGNQLASDAYYLFNGFISTAHQSIHSEGKQEGGLHIDIHGHLHETVDLGYLIRTSDLNKPSLELETYRTSSIKHLLKRKCNDNLQDVLGCYDNILRGNASLGSLLYGHRILALPSPVLPRPHGGKYYRGGYITQMYGSKYAGRIDSIQVEINSSNRLNRKQRRAFVKKLALAIVNFREMHYV